MGGLERCIGLHALQPVPCSLGFAWAERGMGALHMSLPGVVPLGAIRLSHCPAAHGWPLHFKPLNDYGCPLGPYAQTQT